MRVAKEGWPFIIGFWALLVGFFLLHWMIAFWIWLPVAIWVIAFFRDTLFQVDRDQQRRARLTRVNRRCVGGEENAARPHCRGQDIARPPEARLPHAG